MSKLPKEIFIVILVVGGFVNLSDQTLAYDNNTTHPALTDEIVEFYNSSNPDDKITPEQKEWIVEGSILEDTPPRWINHFYDPIYKVGWTGDKAGIISPETMLKWSSIVTSFEPVSSLDWVHNQKLQLQYNLYGGDRTWEAALKYFTQGNEKEAFITLGYVMHLLEDLSVPEHTRNDTHAQELSMITEDTGSPYEEYTRQYTRANIESSLHILNSLKNSGVRPASCSDLDSCMISLAEYSNKYFFSKDTINDPKYNAPVVVRHDNNFGYGGDDSNLEFPLAKVEFSKDSSSGVIASYYLMGLTSNTPILDAYFSRLSKKAVVYGAGVVGLFKTKAAKAAADYEVNKEFQFQTFNPALKGLVDIQTQNVSFFGELSRLAGLLNSATAYVYNAAQNAYYFILRVVWYPGSKQTSLVYESADTQKTAVLIGDVSPLNLVAETAPDADVKQDILSDAEADSATRSLTAAQMILAALPEDVSSATGSVTLSIAASLLTGGGGGVAVVESPPSAESQSLSAEATSTGTSTLPATEENSTSTDLSQSTSTTEASSTVNSVTVIQGLDADSSRPSWYSNNWYQLGTGFWGTVRSLKFRGYINDESYASSTLTLQEFLDPNYSALNRTFAISNDAPFTATSTEVTVDDLNILLQPNKYYRLDTYQRYQNRSVILLGTAATGTAMWNEFIYGTGGVSHAYDFYPYLAVVMDRDTPLLSPNEPSGPSFQFDTLNSVVNASWASSTDPDTTDNLLTYEVNFSTSSVLANVGWRSVGKNLSFSFPVAFSEGYQFGVRAVDDFGAVSTVNATSWNFPPGYFPLPKQLDHSTGLGGGRQKIVLEAPALIDAVYMWGVGGPGSPWCCSQSFLQIFSDASGTFGELVASSSPYTFGSYPGDGGAEIYYPFPSSVSLPANAYWFMPTQGPSDRTNGTNYFGSATDAYSGGFWDDGSGADTGKDAYFRLRSAVNP